MEINIVQKPNNNKIINIERKAVLSIDPELHSNMHVNPLSCNTPSGF